MSKRKLMLGFSSTRRGDGASALIGALAVSAAMLLGGGGTPAPLAEMGLQLLIAVLFSLWLIWFPVVPQGQMRLALVISGMLLAVPVIQLVPLPPVFWHALPGRELERASLGLIGAADSWRPLSMAPARTVNALLALVPPVVVLLITGTLSSSGRMMVVRTIAGMSLLAVVVGAAQTTGGEDNPLRFYTPDVGYLNGFQANHNSAADVLLIGMVAYVVAVQDWIERARHSPTRLVAFAILLTGVALLSIGVVLTASRAGTALLPIAWAGVWAATRQTWGFPARKLALGAVVAGLALAAALFLLRGNAVLSSLLARYEFSRELRPQIWVDSLHAARTYYPVGAGLGGFLPVFLASERLEAVHPAVPNRAHNDYLELAIEAGVLGFLVLAVLVALLAPLLVRQLRAPSSRLRRQAIFVAATFTIVALHSQVDYPMRSIALACIAAASAGLLVPVARGPQGADVPVET